MVQPWLPVREEVLRRRQDAGIPEGSRRLWRAVWLVINTGGHKLESATYYPGTVIQDANQSIGRAYDAKVTPHCFVIDGKGTLVYKGAIDSISSAKSADIEKANNYVLAAVKAVKEGKAPEVSSSKPYGCGVKYNKL